jgi:hypothetical protein
MGLDRVTGPAEGKTNHGGYVGGVQHAHNVIVGLVPVQEADLL